MVTLFPTENFFEKYISEIESETILTACYRVIIQLKIFLTVLLEYFDLSMVEQWGPLEPAMGPRAFCPSSPLPPSTALDRMTIRGTALIGYNYSIRVTALLEYVDLNLT